MKVELPSAMITATAAVRRGADAAGEAIVAALCQASGGRREGPWREQLEQILDLLAQQRRPVEIGDDERKEGLVAVELVAGEEDLVAAGVEVELVAGEEDLVAAGVEVELVVGEDEVGVEVELVADEEDLVEAGVEVELVVGEEDLVAAVEPRNPTHRTQVEALDRLLTGHERNELRSPPRPAPAVRWSKPASLASRERGGRSKTIGLKRLTKDELRIGALLYPERSYWRPRNRGDCANVPRPCPFVGCKYHLFVDINPSSGSIKLNLPELEVWELRHSCALDVASIGGSSLEEVGEILNVSRERIRQVEADGLLKLNRAAPQLKIYVCDPLSDDARTQGNQPRGPGACAASSTAPR